MVICITVRVHVLMIGSIRDGAFSWRAVLLWFC